MNDQFVQHLRYKLQKRIRRLNSISDSSRYHYQLIQFWNYLQSENLFKGILDELKLACPECEEKAKEIIEEESYLDADTELKHSATCYFLLRHCIDQKDDVDIEYHITSNFTRSSYADDVHESRDRFHSTVVESLYEYIDENLDDQRAILALLRRYKYRSEWFNRSELYNRWNSDTQKGEASLAYNMYEYLFDQGLDFTIEPRSASGEADLVSAQTGDERLVADAKIFNPSKSKGLSYIADGVSQIYDYTCDYNQNFGYLIIFKTCRNELNFALTDISQGTPNLVYNNKSIFLITIDIYDYEKSASQRGNLKSYKITEDDLIEVIEEED